MAHGMTAEPIARRAMRRSRTRQDRIEYKVLFALGFVVFLVAAIASRLLPGWWMARSRETTRTSVFAEARAATSATIPFAFMG